MIHRPICSWSRPVLVFISRHHSSFRRKKMQMTNLWMRMMWYYLVWQFLWNLRWNMRGILKAGCEEYSRAYFYNSINLNLHLANINGHVEPGSDYIKTCTEEGYNDQEGSSFFSFANCKKENGNFIIPTKYDINHNVANVNGILKWKNCKLNFLAMDRPACCCRRGWCTLNGRKLLNQRS